MTITLANTSLKEDTEIEICLPETYHFTGEAAISLLHEEVHAYNTFEQPEKVKAAETTKNWDTNRHCYSLPAVSAV